MVSAFQKWWLRPQDKKEDKEHEKSPKKFEDVELQGLLDENDSQTQKQLAEQLGVSQQSVSNRLREMGKIQKTIGKWKSAKTCDICLLGIRYKGKSFLHHIVAEDKRWIYLENPKQKIIGKLSRTIHIYRNTGA